jgi:hypothetical protein
MWSYAPPKSREFELWEFRDSHLGVLGQKTIWMWPPWRGAEYTIRGTVVDSPKFEPLWVRGCLWLVITPKMPKLCINHLVLVLCMFMWVAEACQFFLVPSRSSNTPVYPSKVLQAKERALIIYSSIIFSLDSHLNPSRNLRNTSTNLIFYVYVFMLFI